MLAYLPHGPPNSPSLRVRLLLAGVFQGHGTTNLHEELLQEAPREDLGERTGMAMLFDEFFQSIADRLAPREAARQRVRSSSQISWASLTGSP